MSSSTQKEFVVSVQKNYDRFSSYLNLERPSFETKGFLSIAKMKTSGGAIEILCGPPEYHAEIFIACHENHKRWGLADLFQIERVKNWLNAYRSQTKNQSEIEADVEWVFYLIVEGVQGIDEFAWIHKTR